MAVDLSLVKKLREQTGIGILECKKAIEEADNDFKKAEEILRKKGFEKAKSKSSRTTNQGVIAIHAEGQSLVMLEVNCETDFVAKNEDFLNLANDIAAHIYQTKTENNNVEQLNTQKFYKNQDVTINELITEKIHKIGENIVIRRFMVSTLAEPGVFGSYIHSNKKIGVCLELGVKNAANTENNSLDVIAKDISMQIAAMNPLYISEANIPEEILEKEKDIYREQMKKSGKPENIIEKIIQGKLGKYYSEVCLIHQKFFKDDKLSVNNLVAEKAKEIDDPITIRNFIRYQVGEDI